MINFSAKKTVLTLIICLIAFMSKAQVGYNYSQYDIGVAAGLNQVFGDVKTSPISATVNFNITYNATPYTNFVFEAQLGKLNGGDSLATKGLKRQFNNDYSGFIFRGQLQAGELIDYSGSPIANAAKNLYLSVGIGYAVNHITSINRKPSYNSYGSNNSQEPFLPLRVGYEFKIFNQYNQPSVKIDFAYNVNFIFGDNLDGYSGGFNNKGNDVYTQISIGAKFAIGGSLTSYRKQIVY